MCATANVFVTGAVPEQQFSTLIPWMMEKYGKKVYTIAADYNFGQISAEWVRSLVAEGGGAMVGEEFIPLSVSQFSQTIQNIQKAAPDFVVTLLVGANQASYYEQQAAAQVNLPMASSVNVGQAYEHKRFKPPALKDMYVTANYVEEVDSPASNDFKKRFRAKFPDVVYINQEAANSYNAVYLYKAAVEKAASTDDEGRAPGPRKRRHLHRRTLRARVHRPRQPSWEPHDLSGARQRRSLGGDSEDLERHPAILAR